MVAAVVAARVTKVRGHAEKSRLSAMVRELGEGDLIKDSSSSGIRGAASVFGE